MKTFSFGPVIRQYIAVITVNLSIFASGLGLAWPSPVLVKLRNETETILSRPITEVEGSWIVSIGFLISILAFVTSIFLVDFIGRKKCVIIAYAPKIVSGFVFIFAGQVWHLYIGRILNSIGDAVFFGVVPIYASEIASKELRGSLGTILQIMCSIGILIMYCTGPFISFLNLNIFYTFMICSTFIPILFIPDSPYYLYSVGKVEETSKILTFLRGSEYLATEEIKEYDVQKEASEVNISRMELIKNSTFIKSLLLTTIFAACSQIVGFNAVTYYLQTVFESTQTTISPEVSSVVVGFIQLTASFCTAALTDKFGRKPILLTSMLVMTLGMVGLGIFFCIKEGGKDITGFLNFLPLLSLILVVFSYSAGFGSLLWLMQAELFDSPSRGIGVPTVSALNSIFVFITTRYFPLLIASIGPATTYFIFSVNCVLTIVFIAFCIPETKGKSFSEIQKALGASSSSNKISLKTSKSVEKNINVNLNNI